MFALLIILSLGFRCLLSWRENSSALRALARDGAMVWLGAEPTCHESPTAEEQNVLEILVGHERVSRCLDVLMVPRKTRISFVGRPFPSGAVDTLRKLSWLDAVSVDGFLATDPAFGDRELMGVAQIPGLRSFSLQTNWTVTDEGVGSLANAQQLEHLLLADCASISGAGLAKFAALHRLRTLYLGKLAVGDHLSAALRDKPELESLTLVDMDISARNLEAIASLPCLRSLSLASSRFGSGSFGALSTARAIRDLDLRFTAVSDTDLLLLVGLKELQRVKLGGTPVSDRGAASLAAVLTCVVER